MRMTFLYHLDLVRMGCLAPTLKIRTTLTILRCPKGHRRYLQDLLLVHFIVGTEFHRCISIVVDLQLLYSQQRCSLRNRLKRTLAILLLFQQRQYTPFHKVLSRLPNLISKLGHPLQRLHYPARRTPRKPPRPSQGRRRRLCPRSQKPRSLFLLVRKSVISRRRRSALRQRR